MEARSELPLALPDPAGPSVTPDSVWRQSKGGSTAWRVRTLVDVDGEPYVLLERDDRGYYDDEPPQRQALPLLTLLRQWRRQDFDYPRTVRCTECETSATATEPQLEAAGWWLIGFGNGPFCPQHSP